MRHSALQTGESRERKARRIRMTNSRVIWSLKWCMRDVVTIVAIIKVTTAEIIALCIHRIMHCSTQTSADFTTDIKQHDTAGKRL